jgi:ketosteroid isomerase-like protein
MTPASDPHSAPTAHLRERFNAAFLEHAPEKLDDLLADDCVIENTVSAANGDRNVGTQRAWAYGGALPQIVERALNRSRSTPSATGRSFFGATSGAGQNDSIHGVNIIRVRDGLIVEALGYVKGAN